MPYKMSVFIFIMISFNSYSIYVNSKNNYFYNFDCGVFVSNRSFFCPDCCHWLWFIVLISKKIFVSVCVYFKSIFCITVNAVYPHFTLYYLFHIFWKLVNAWWMVMMMMNKFVPTIHHITLFYFTFIIAASWNLYRIYFTRLFYFSVLEKLLCF